MAIETEMAFNANKSIHLNDLTFLAKTHFHFMDCFTRRMNIANDTDDL